MVRPRLFLVPPPGPPRPDAADDDATIRWLWNESKAARTPLLVRKREGPIVVCWRGRRWTAARASFADRIHGALARFGRVHVVQPYRAAERCSPRCMGAAGVLCACSCLGRNHGGSAGRAYDVIESHPVVWRGEPLRWSLMVRGRVNA